MTLFSRINFYLDKSCKPFVGAIVVLVNAYSLLHFPTSIYIPVFTVNALLNAGLSKVLKRLINQSRPAGAAKLSPGMPSNHATTLAFFCWSTVYGLQRYRDSVAQPGRTPNGQWSLTPAPTVPDIPARWIPPLQGVVVWYSVYLTALRVVQLHHTVAQVVVGYAFGTSWAVLCLAANYAGYDGDRVGGRIDELSVAAKTAVAVGSTCVSLVAALLIFRGAKRSRMATHTVKSHM